MRWGFQKGKQRFRCKQCGQLFFWRNDHKKLDQQFVWFRKWILKRQIYDDLSKEKGASRSTLQRLFKRYLDKAPSFQIRKRPAHLIIDGTYFKNKLCLVLYYDHHIGYVQMYRFSDRERYEEIREDLEQLKRIGVQIESITCDGHRALLKAIKKVFPTVTIQRCLVHIQRMSRQWLSSRAKSDCARDLLLISQQVCNINTIEQSHYWMAAFVRWDQRYQSFISEKVINSYNGRYWYKHKMIRRVRYLLIRALPNMFHYVNNPEISSSTNPLEGYFSHLKNHLNIHRGLTMQHRRNFIRWYLHFNNNSR